MMNAVADVLTLGLKLHQAGDLSQAQKFYQEVLRISPHCADALHLLGLLLHQSNQSESATEYLRQAIALESNNLFFNKSLALIYRDSGQLAAAVDQYRQVLTLQPDDAESHYNLGVVLRQLDRLAEAADAFERAVETDPGFAKAHYNLGSILVRLERIEPAISAFEQAIRLDPTHSEAHKNLAVLLSRQSRLDDAIEHFEQTLRFAPQDPQAHVNIGSTLLLQGRSDEAAASFRQALCLEPEQTLWRLKLNAICPAVMTSPAEIQHWRANFRRALDHYDPGSIVLIEQGHELVTAGICPPFNLPYHGQNDLPLKTQFAQLFQFGSRPTHPSSAPPYRIGFLVTESHEGIFYSLMRGLVNHFTHPDFEPSIICAPSGLARLKVGITNPRVNFITIPSNLPHAIERLRAERLDLIYYWEVGSDPLNYFLPFFRLAPVQCTSWGLSVTTGIPQMDFMLSSDLLEPDLAETHYSERLVKFKTLPTYFYRPQPPSPLKRRSDFGLPEGGHIYLCPQNLLKFHPDFDPILGDILRRDPLGRLVLLKSKIERQNQALLARFQVTMPDVVERVVWLPQLEFLDYLNLIAVADVMLDTLHYGGGNTSHEALAIGTPVVTLPGPFLRGRLTLGRYQKMGLSDCIAETPEQYIDLSVRLGRDSDFRHEIAAKILDRSDLLFEDITAVQEFEQFCRRAIESVKPA